MSTEYSSWSYKVTFLFLNTFLCVCQGASLRDSVCLTPGTDIMSV